MVKGGIGVTQPGCFDDWVSGLIGFLVLLLYLISGKRKAPSGIAPTRQRHRRPLPGPALTPAALRTLLGAPGAGTRATFDVEGGFKSAEEKGDRP